RRSRDAQEDARHEEPALPLRVAEAAEERRRQDDDHHREDERERELLAPARHAARDVEREVEREDDHREARRPELVGGPRADRRLRRAHRRRSPATGRREGRISWTRITPATKPPTCAHHATPPPPWTARRAEEIELPPIQNCMRNQKRR